MFDHVKFGVGDYTASKAFYVKALAPLGITAGAEGALSYGIEFCAKGETATLCLFQTDEKPAHLHRAFVAETRQQCRCLLSRGAGGWWPRQRHAGPAPEAR